MASLHHGVALPKHRELEIENDCHREEKRARQIEQHTWGKMGFEQLPCAILFEIVTRLPIRSLMRLRFTCKFWYTILTDPEFKDLHLSHAIKNPGYLFVSFEVSARRNHIYFAEEVGSNLEITKLFQSSFLPDNMFGMYASSGGLMAYYAFGRKCYYIFNPIIGEQVKVPPYPDLGRELPWGFGYSRSTKEYKIVKFGYLGYHPNIILLGAIYTLGSDSWREIPHVPTPPTDKHVDCNGILFWVISKGIYDSGPDTIMSFDIGSEKFSTWRGPADGIKRPVPISFSDLINLEDTVALVMRECSHIRIWVLRDKVKDIWINEYDICTDYFITLQQMNFSILGLWMNCDLFCITERNFVSYDANCRKIRSIKKTFNWNENCLKKNFNVNERNWFKGCFRYAFPHAGSLISPSRIVAMAKKSS